MTTMLLGSRAARRGMAVVLSLALGAGALDASAQTPLTDREFRQIREQGMGDKHNSYAWVLHEFKGKMYFGSNRDFLCFVQDLLGSDLKENAPELPLECPEILVLNDNRGRLFEYDPRQNTVRLAYLSPNIKTLLSDGTIADVPRDNGFRAAATFIEQDGTEAMYIFTHNSRQLPQGPARVLRSTDGVNFKEIRTPFSDDPGVTSFRSALIYKNRLYVCVIGAEAKDSVMLEAIRPDLGEFRVAHEPFFGDPSNDAPYRLAEFKGYLYVGMANALTGYQLLRTDASGEPPYHFDTVLKFGAYRGQLNQNVVSLQGFKDHIYVGSGILFGGWDVLRDVGPAPAEMVRVDAQGRWELICGTPRDTPDGYRAPLTGLGPGFGNPFTGYMWRMDVSRDVLYLGTFDSSYIMQFIDGMPASVLLNLRDSINADPSRFSYLTEPTDPNMPLDELWDLVSAHEGGFDFYSTVDGVQWNLVSKSGFNDHFNYGVRTMEPVDYGMYIGVNNPFFGFSVWLGQDPGTDSDGDFILDKNDNCPFDWNRSQSDIDGDGIGDSCDPDNDADCILDSVDPIPGNASQDMTDVDEDGIPDRCDTDNDNDEYLDTQDNCDFTPNPDQFDTDGDGLGDACDPDNAAANAIGTDGTLSAGPSIGGLPPEDAASGDASGGATGGDSSPGDTTGDAVGGDTASNDDEGAPPPLCGLGALFGLPLMAAGLQGLRSRGDARTRHRCAER